MKNLREMYLSELRETYAGARTTMPVITELAREARDPRLSQALIDMNRMTAQGIDALGGLFRAHEADPTIAVSKMAETMVAETRRRVISAEFADMGTRDMAILAQARRLLALSLSAWSTLGDIARRLSATADVTVLDTGIAAVRQTMARMDDLTMTILPAAQTGD